MAKEDAGRILSGFMDSVGAGTSDKVNPVCKPPVNLSVPTARDVYGHDDKAKKKPPKRPK